MDSGDGKEKGGITAARKGEEMKSLEKATADYELPGRVEIQKEEIKADDESGKNETEEENKY